MADALEDAPAEILEANERDMEAGARGEPRRARCSTACGSTRSASAGIAGDVRDVAALPDPVGEAIEGHRLPNGLELRRCACRWAWWPWSTRRGRT